MTTHSRSFASRLNERQLAGARWPLRNGSYWGALLPLYGAVAWVAATAIVTPRCDSNTPGDRHIRDDGRMLRFA